MESDVVMARPPLLLPQPQDLTVREKEDAMGAYLMMFAAWGAGSPYDDWTHRVDHLFLH